MFFWSSMLSKLGVDDAIDAVGVHLGAGIWGVIAVPFFNFNTGNSLLYSGTTDVAWYILGWNLAGVVTIIVYTAGIMIPIFVGLKMIGFLRVTDDHLAAGIDLVEHGEMAYVIDLPFQKYQWKYNTLRNQYNKTDTKSHESVGGDLFGASFSSEPTALADAMQETALPNQPIELVGRQTNI